MGFFSAVIMLATLFFASGDDPGAPNFEERPDRVIVMSSPGGNIFMFQAAYISVADSGKRLEIRGECNSACTLFLGIVPPERVCVTPRAELGFHQASKSSQADPRPVPTEGGTTVITRFYPPWVMAWIERSGGLPPPGARPAVIVMPFMVLRAHFSQCED